TTSFTNREIKPSRSKLFVIANPSVLSDLQMVDIPSMQLGNFGSCPLVVREIVAGVNEAEATLRITLCQDTKTNVSNKSTLRNVKNCGVYNATKLPNMVSHSLEDV
ncbi:hypothetical protein ACTXT7_007600, partial [Hymenolepis weldensis]